MRLNTIPFVLVFAALATLGCTRPLVPAHVRARVAYREASPAGTWVRTEPDGSTSTLTFSTPEGRRQLFAVELRNGDATLRGEALVDGTQVYATRHTGSGANDLCLYLYDRRADGTLEALWGSNLAIAEIAYEEARPAVLRDGNWNGVYAEWGNNMGGRYEDRLIIGPALDGTAGLHRLHWTQPSRGWYRGMAFEFGERLVGVRLPGVLVRETSWTSGSYTYSQRTSEVGRDVLWFVGAYRMEGDALVGVEASNAQQGLVEVRWTRADAATQAPAPAPAVESAPAIDPEPVESAPAIDPEPEGEPAMEEPAADVEPTAL